MQCREKERGRETTMQTLPVETCPAAWGGLGGLQNQKKSESQKKTPYVCVCMCFPHLTKLQYFLIPDTDALHVYEHYIVHKVRVNVSLFTHLLKKRISSSNRNIWTGRMEKSGTPQTVFTFLLAFNQFIRPLSISHRIFPKVKGRMRIKDGVRRLLCQSVVERVSGILIKSTVLCNININKNMLWQLQ